MTIEQIITFFGWCSVINAGILLFSSIALVSMRNVASKIHSKMFGVDKSDLSKLYFNYLANYKIIVIIFNIAPYIALKVMMA